MNEKLRNHVNILWAAIPKNVKADEIKEELLRNLDDKYNDLLANGYDQTAAFHIALSGIGDLDELFRECGGTVHFNTVTSAVASVPPVIVYPRPSQMPLCLGLTFIFTILGPGLWFFWILWGAVGLGFFSLFACWAIAGGSFIYAIAAIIVSLFTGSSYQSEGSLRKVALVLVIILLSFIVFAFVYATVSWIWDYNRVPTGPVVKQEREINGDFTLIDIHSVPVEFKLSDKNSVVIETYADIMPLVITEVNNDSLTIVLRASRYHHIKKLRATVYCQTLPKAFFVAGASSLTFNEPIKAESVSFDCSGAGAIHINNFEGEKLNLKITGAGSMDIMGRAESVFVQANGASKLRASGFDASRCDVNLDGASYAELGNISGELSLRATGASRFHYNGTPAIKKWDISGASRVVSSTIEEKQ